MLPLRDSDTDTGHADDLSSVGTDPVEGELAQVAAGWDLDSYSGGGGVMGRFLETVCG